jgi:hypothetical protein
MAMPCRSFCLVASNSRRELNGLEKQRPRPPFS